jgi:WhiB family redox-sensing transcriptional regulator
MSTHTSWMSLASCQSVDPETFFPSSTGIPGQREVERAVLICRSCPVILECQEYSKKFARGNGVWGGIYKGRHAPRPPGRPKRREPWPINHGTVAGYQQHHKQGVPLCEECVSANKAYRRARRTA